MENLLGSTLSGIFWVTDNPTTKFEGSLAIDESGSGTLNIQGEALELHALDQRERFHIHGTAGGKPITLFDCFTSWIPLLPHDKNARIAVNIIAAGAWIDSPDAKIAEVLSFTSPEMILWTGLRGLTHQWSPKSKMAVKYRGKKTQTVQIGDATLQFSTGVNYSSSQSETSLVERHGVRIVFSEPQSILASLRWATKTCRLLSLALRRPTSCRLYTLEQKANDRITLVTHLSASETTEATIHPLFTRPEMGAKYAKVLRTWFAKYDNLEPVISLRVALLSKPERYLVFEFLTYMQALEALHRRTRPSKTIVSRARFSALRLKLIDAIPDKWRRKSDFVERFSFLNEISLATRLTDIFASDKQVVGKLFKDTKKDIALIRDIRNYLTHYEGKRKAQIEAYMETVKFWYLTSKIKILLEIGILRNIGFGRLDVQKLIEQNPEYSHLCKVDHLR